MRERALCVCRQRCAELETLIQNQQERQADNGTGRSSTEDVDQETGSQAAEIEQLKHQLEVCALYSHSLPILICFVS